jgi:hypothetical protein
MDREKIVLDDSGRLIDMVVDERVDKDHELAVQALPIEHREAASGQQDEVVDANHPLAVQALPRDPHPWAHRLSDKERKESEKRRRRHEGRGDGSPETEESFDRSMTVVEDDAKPDDDGLVHLESDASDAERSGATVTHVDNDA